MTTLFLSLFFSFFWVGKKTRRLGTTNDNDFLFPGTFDAPGRLVGFGMGRTDRNTGQTRSSTKPQMCHFSFFSFENLRFCCCLWAGWSVGGGMGRDGW